MAGLDIVGLGLSTVDVLLRLRDMPTWERPGRLSGFALDGGGLVGTACVAAARLGARVGYIGTAGNDHIAQLKVGFLTNYGVDVSRLVHREGPESQVVIVYVNEESGERAFQGLTGFVDMPVQPEELDRGYLTSASFLHLDGFHPQAALQAAQWVREAGGKVCMDCSRTSADSVAPGTGELLRHVDVLICGAGFGRALTGYGELWEAGCAMLEVGPTLVVQTEAEDGCYTTTADEQFHTPAFRVDVVDTTGAGDVFHGAYLVGLLRRWDSRTVARFASAVAAMKCTRLGGRRGIPTCPEVRAFLSQRGAEVP